LPDTAEYLTRIRGLAQSTDPLEMQRHTPKHLAALIASATLEDLSTRPAKDKWSIGEILAHLAEDEIATACRYRQMVEHDGIDLAGFDQDLWARLGNYTDRDPRESLALFRLLRDANLQFLQRLSPQQWECSGMHAERGRITVRELAAHMAGHDANHVEQIRRILAER
jgi:DinB family protein